MLYQWRLLCDNLWPEPRSSLNTLPEIQPGLYKNTHFLLPYKDPAVKNSIRNNKFHFHTKSAKDLSIKADHFLKRYPEAKIIPIPSSRSRERKRGYQHLLNILQHSQYRDNVRPNILKKIINTKQQSHVSKQARLQQQTGSFQFEAFKIPANTHSIILFDDVVTTESTISAARTTIEQQIPAGIKIINFAIAH